VPPAAAGAAARGAASAPPRTTAYTGTRARRHDRPADSGPERPSDARRRRREAKERDQPLAAAYEAGRSGGPRPDDPELAGYYDDGAKETKQRRKAEEVDAAKPTATGPALGKTGARLADDGAGFFVGMFAYAVLVNYLRGGVPGAKAWLAAKFLNRVGGAGETAPTRSTPLMPSAPNPGGTKPTLAPVGRSR
jgi:hypothetical protein